jgi:hypothetical protein
MNGDLSAPAGEPSSALDHDDRAVPAAEIDALLKKAEIFSRRLAHRRQALRNLVSITVPVIPVDENERQVDEPFIALSRDVSSTGICVVHPRACYARYVVVELRAPGAESIRLLVEVVRRNRIGRLHEIAGKFLRRAADRPAFEATGGSRASK